jgi:hypothetical protein
MSDKFDSLHGFVFYDGPACPICLEQMQESITSLACGHCFHKSCIEDHLLRTLKCPFCRSPARKVDCRPIYYQVYDHAREGKEDESLFFLSRAAKLQDLSLEFISIKAALDEQRRINNEAHKIEAERERFRNKRIAIMNSHLSGYRQKCDKLEDENEKLKYQLRKA